MSASWWCCTASQMRGRCPFGMAAAQRGKLKSTKLDRTRRQNSHSCAVNYWQHCTVLQSQVQAHTLETEVQRITGRFGGSASWMLCTPPAFGPTLLPPPMLPHPWVICLPFSIARGYTLARVPISHYRPQKRSICLP